MDDHPRRIEVRPEVHAIGAFLLLGRGIKRRSHDEAGMGLPRCLAPQLRQAQVADPETALVIQKEVVGLHIAVDPASPVQPSQSREELPSVAHGVLHGEETAFPIGSKPLPHEQAEASRMVLHGEKGLPPREVEIEDFHHVGMAYGPREGSFGQEFFSKGRFAPKFQENGMGAQQLERHDLVHHGKPCLVDDTHPATAKKTEDDILPDGFHGWMDAFSAATGDLPAKGGSP
jgi:hypothetical protein